jgi:uncharacterized membrane protein
MADYPTERVSRIVIYTDKVSERTQYLATVSNAVVVWRSDRRSQTNVSSRVYTGWCG